MKIALLMTALLGLTYGSHYTLQTNGLKNLQDVGARYLGGVISKLNSDLKSAVSEFRDANATCMSRYETAVVNCRACVNGKCVARAKHACRPSDWELILQHTGHFITAGIPDFLFGTVPNFIVNDVGGVFVDVGGELIDITEDVGRFLLHDVGGFFAGVGAGIGSVAADVGNGIGSVAADVGNGIGSVAVGAAAEVGQLLEDTGVAGVATDIGTGVADVAIDIGTGIVDVGEDVIGIAADIGDVAISHGTNIFGTVGGGIGGVIETVGHETGNVLGAIGTGAGSIVDDTGRFIGGIFKGIGKRSLPVRYPQAQPGCSEIKSNAAVACQFYQNTDFCAECGFSIAQRCPEYAAAAAKVRAANSNREWMSKTSSSTYGVFKTSFNSAHRNASTQKYNSVEVDVHIFGKDLKFTVNEPINPYDPEVAGPVIAEQALQLFKAAA